MPRGVDSELRAVAARAARVAEHRENLLQAVAACRQIGATWEQIGQVLGVTPQAAHSRFRRPVERVLAEGGPKFHVERWSRRREP